MEFKRNTRKWFLPGLIGALIGALVILAATSYLQGENSVKTAADVGKKAVMDGKALAADDNQESEVTRAVKKAKDAVVSVVNFQQGSGDILQGTTPKAVSSGSGVIYKKEGSKAYIVTNHHVVDGATQLEVNLNNGDKLQAKLLGSDPLSDLAVLQVDGKKISDVIEMGESDHLEPGASAIAIGNPLGFLQGTVTKGVISAAQRTMPVDLDQNGAVDWQAEVIQTDASINPGNSGGALIDINGQLIGINSSKISQDAVEGIGFAIPVSAAKPIMKDLEKYGEVRRPFIGIGPMSLDEIPSQYWSRTLHLPASVKKGIVVMSVASNSPAQKAGLKKLDVITSIDNNKINDALGLRKYLYRIAKPGDKVKITFYREGKEKAANLTIEQGQASAQ
jgi:serine protease Do